MKKENKKENDIILDQEDLDQVSGGILYSPMTGQIDLDVVAGFPSIAKSFPTGIDLNDFSAINFMIVDDIKKRLGK